MGRVVGQEEEKKNRQAVGGRGKEQRGRRKTKLKINPLSYTLATGHHPWPPSFGKGLIQSTGFSLARKMLFSIIHLKGNKATLHEFKLEGGKGSQAQSSPAPGMLIHGLSHSVTLPDSFQVVLGCFWVDKATHIHWYYIPASYYCQYMLQVGPDPV